MDDITLMTCSSCKYDGLEVGRCESPERFEDIKNGCEKENTSGICPYFEGDMHYNMIND